MLVSRTDPKWVRVAMGDFDRLLLDHAHCEKKAAATALSLVASYPGHEALVRKLTSIAIEELRHFQAVYGRLRRRGLSLERDRGDPYARALVSLVRPGMDSLTDRLLVAALIEARSRERLQLLGEALSEPAWKSFYLRLAEAEARHADQFVSLARVYRIPGEVEERLAQLASEEARILHSLPVLPRVH